MALNPRETSVNREQVQAWLDEFVGLRKPTKKMKDHLTTKLVALNLGDDKVNTSAHDDLKNETSLVDMILLDLDSYA